MSRGAQKRLLGSPPVVAIDSMHNCGTDKRYLFDSMKASMDLGQLDRKEWESCFEDWCSAVQNVVAPHTYPMMKTFQYSMMGKPIHSLQKGAYCYIMLDSSAVYSQSESSSE